MSKSIHHTGTVESVAGGCVQVRILQSSACAACQAARLCRSGESRERLLTVPTPSASLFRKGQRVVVEGSMRMGLKAVAIAYVAPLVLLMAVVMAAVALGAGEPEAALCGLAALVPYGALLWCLRGVLQRKLALTVRALAYE